MISVAAGGDISRGSVSFALVAEPQLAISQSSSNACVVSWPSWCTDAVLESSTNLLTGTWATVTNPPSFGNGSYHVVWTNTVGMNFFRLRQ